ncbi:MAG: alpha,2-mannosyltransferase [Chthoniobacter sp.]|nr:alpha,2-mannosyltransferase [Chthoniobacter sp.]
MNHREFGRRFLAREFLYENGLNIPYPPAWAMAHAPFALLPARVAMPLFFLLGATSLLGVLHLLRVVSRRAIPLSERAAFWTAVTAVVLASRFLLRDFADGGQNTVLLGLTLAGFYLWTSNHAVSGGAALGLAIALKCTPALLLLYFLWKRQWKIAAAAIAFALCFALLPALWLGSRPFAKAATTWFHNVQQTVSRADPSIGILGPEPIQNKALRPAFARYLMQLPPGHPGRFDSPAYVDFFRLSPREAQAVIGSFLLVLLILAAWQFRTAVAERDTARMWWECAIVLLLMPLFSPISWGQHFVAALPALYFAMRQLTAQQRSSRGTLAALAVFGLVVLGTNRALVGRDVSLLLESYHLVTLAALLLLGVAFTWHARRVAVACPTSAR